jgi:hypothetical protein
LIEIRLCWNADSSLILAQEDNFILFPYIYDITKAILDEQRSAHLDSSSLSSVLVEEVD